MVFTVCLFCVLVGFFLAGAITMDGGEQLIVFETPVFIFLMAALALASLFCVVRRWKAWKHIGFHLTHIGAALLIFGAGVSFYRVQENTGLQIPVNPTVEISDIPRADPDDEGWPTVLEGDEWMQVRTVPLGSLLPIQMNGARLMPMERIAYVKNREQDVAILYEPVVREDHTGHDHEGSPPDPLIDLPFSFSVTDFEVEYYRPNYDLYDLKPDTPVHLETYRPEEDGSLDMGVYGSVSAGELMDAQDEWVPRYDVESEYEDEHDADLVLGQGMVTPKHFEATLEVQHEGETRTEQLMVNHPLEVEGWRIFLDSHAEGSITVSVKRDPGRPYVYAGIWMLIIGIAIICFRKQGRVRCTSPKS